MTTSWTGNWQQRIVEKIRTLGFENVGSFVAAREGKTFGELAKELAPDVAPVHVEMLYLRESLKDGCFIAAAAECLARTVVERFPRGWGTGGRLEYRTVGVMVDWAADMLLDVEQSELSAVQLKAVAAALRDTVQPPTGWLPKNGQDPLIRCAFSIGLAASKG